MKVRNLLPTALRNLAADEKGATAVEYGLIVFGIAVAIAAVVGTIGTQLNTIFGQVYTAIGGT